MNIQSSVLEKNKPDCTPCLHVIQRARGSFSVAALQRNLEMLRLCPIYQAVKNVKVAGKLNKIMFIIKSSGI